MSTKPARNHHYVPQLYLRNFSSEDKIIAFNTKEMKLFNTSPRNVASEKDLYRLEGPEPGVAEKMFGEIESLVTPILSEVIKSGKLPPKESDDFVSLLYFISLLEVRHPGQLSRIEEFMKTVMERSIDLFAHHIPEKGKKLISGEVVTREEAKNAAQALMEGRIKIHIPRDHSLVTSLKTAETITETLLARNWTLATAEENDFITSSKPLLLLWDDLVMHQRHPAGFGLTNTTVYFPVSPRLTMIGKFDQLKESCNLDMKAVAAINGLHSIFSPHHLFSQKDTSIVQLGSTLVPFKSLDAEFKKLSTLSGDDVE